MVRLYFPMKKYNKDTGEVLDSCCGNVLWDISTRQPDHLVKRALQRIRDAGLWCSPFPEGDGVAFDRGELSNYRILLLMRGAFSWLKLKPCPHSGEQYYTICDVTTDSDPEKNLVTLSGPDVFTGYLVTVTIPAKEYETLVNGQVVIQKAVPSLSAAEREFLITGNSKALMEERRKNGYDEEF